MFEILSNLKFLQHCLSTWSWFFRGSERHLDVTKLSQ